MSFDNTQTPQQAMPVPNISNKLGPLQRVILITINIFESERPKIHLVTAFTPELSRTQDKGRFSFRQ